MTTRNSRSRANKPRRPAITPEILDRMPPEADESERALLRCVITDCKRMGEVLEIIGPEHFRLTAHQVVFSHLQRLHNQGVPFDDPAVVGQSLKDAGDLKRIGGVICLADIMAPGGAPSHAAHHARTVLEKAQRRVLLRACERGIQLAHGNGEIQEVHAELRELLDPEAGEGNGHEPEILTLTDVLTRQVTADYVVPGLLAADCPGVVGGLFKSLKTSFALDLFISIGTGTPCLGFFPVNRLASAVYFCGEGGLAFICDVCRRICRAKGVEGEDSKLRLVPWIPVLDTEQHLNALANVLRKTTPEFGFFDPFYQALGEASSAASNVYVMGQRMQALLRVCEPTHTTPILVHHFKKTRDENSPASLADLSQAGLAEFAGQWCLLSRQSPYDPERPGSHDLWLTLGSRLGHSARWSVQVEEGRQDVPGGRYWQTQVASPEDARDRVKEQREQERNAKTTQRIEADKAVIIRAMSKYRPGETKSIVKDASGLRSEHFKAAFAELLREGDVVPCELVKPCRKTPFPAFKLA